MSNDMQKIVVTGMGALTPFGQGVSPLWQALLDGKSCIAPLTCFDTKDFLYSQGGQMPDSLCPADGTVDRASHFMLTAAAEALSSAGFTPDAGNHVNTAVVLSTNFGGIISGERIIAGVKTGAPATATDATGYAMQTCADRLASDWGLGGARAMLSLSCSSGTAALCYGMDLIRAGRADVVVTGGYDALSRFAWSGLCALRTMTRDKVRPFDKNRAGTIFSEGAGAIVLESLTHARKRGAIIHAEVAGGWLNNNAFHMTAPAKEGAGSAMVMKRALEDAAMPPEAIDHINAHGTGTKPNDVTETQAIKTVFGAHAKSIAVTSIKGSIGHLMGAAGSVEAIASILSMTHGIIPPTINFQVADPECDLDYVFNKPREKKISAVLSNSAGIGGCNAAVIFRREGAA